MTVSFDITNVASNWTFSMRAPQDKAFMGDKTSNKSMGNRALKNFKYAHMILTPY